MQLLDVLTIQPDSAHHSFFMSWMPKSTARAMTMMGNKGMMDFKELDWLLCGGALLAAFGSAGATLPPCRAEGGLIDGSEASACCLHGGQVHQAP